MSCSWSLPVNKGTLTCIMEFSGHARWYYPSSLTSYILRRRTGAGLLVAAVFFSIFFLFNIKIIDDEHVPPRELLSGTPPLQCVDPYRQSRYLYRPTDNASDTRWLQSTSAFDNLKQTKLAEYTGEGMSVSEGLGRYDFSEIDASVWNLHRLHGWRS